MAARNKGKSMLRTIAAIVASIGLGAVGWQIGVSSRGDTQEAVMNQSTTRGGLREAIFAGGCFWCMEAAFELMPGVIEAISGYTGGTVKNPTYEQVSTGTTGHLEAVLVRYDPARTTYEELLDLFWRNVNPTDAGGQFIDRGTQYNTAIFYLNEEQRTIAEGSKGKLESAGVFEEPIVTQILPAETFYPAEAYHQDYHKTYLAQYKAYSTASGREAYLDKMWEGQDDTSLDRSTGGP